MFNVSSVSSRCLRRLYVSSKNKTNYGVLSPYFDVSTCWNSPIQSHVGKYIRHKSRKSGQDISSVVKPVKISPSPSDDIDVGADLAGKLKKKQLLKTLNDFFQRVEIKKLAKENGLDSRLFLQAYLSFRRLCADSEHLPADLHITFSDILQGVGHVDDLFPYFIRHAGEIFPHLQCMDDLKKISDLTLPPNWYPEARAIQRKIIFHAGPTNSGKTYHALKSFLEAESGIYCGPLKLLAVEVFKTSNEKGTPCDLVTGEDRKFALDEQNPVNHTSCTVEMTSIINHYDVAILDEIQVIKDPQRGWAWTRALLGLCAKEIHLCGEASAIDLVSDLMTHTGDDFEVRKYKRLTSLTVLDKAVENFNNVMAGDCIVCFSKNDIYYVTRQLENLGKKCAVIYGSLPPGTKHAQAEKFNDPTDPCNIMVATDAIGMGINLAIKRVVFYSLVKPQLSMSGEKEMEVITTSQALQIGGRAGRYGTIYENGEVTTFQRNDLPLLNDVLNKDILPIDVAGLHPTAEQIELFSYHLPNATLSNLIDIFITMCEVDGERYFMCNMDDFKYLADLIEHVPLQLRIRYVFCCAPTPKKQPFVCSMFLKYARKFSKSEPLTLDWLCTQLKWPFRIPKTIMSLVHLEGVFDVLDLYLWLGYRFPDMFPDSEHVQDMQKEMDEIIQLGVYNITKLVKASQTKGGGMPKFDVPEMQFGDDPNLKSELSVQEDVPKGVSQKLHQTRKLRGWSTVDKKKVEANSAVKGGNVTQTLLKKGLINQETLKQLQEEWKKNLQKEMEDDKNK